MHQSQRTLSEDLTTARLKLDDLRTEIADLRDRLAEGVAILSFAPGGVTVFGLHFESRHSEQL
jgi:hypothetical protein